MGESEIVAHPTALPWTLELLESEVFNPHSHEHWWWRATLSKRKDAKYSLRVRQVFTEGRIWRVRGLVGFRRGDALFGFLDAAWRNHAEVVLNESTWTRIAGDIKLRDEGLGGEVLAAVNEAFQRALPLVEMPSPELVGAYRDTDYTVPSGPISLRVDEPVPNLDDWLCTHNGRSAAIITAFNPFSVPTPESQNQRRQDKLRASIEAAGLRHFAASGTARSGNWPGEPSLCVLDPTAAQVDDWLLQFGQYAVVLAVLGGGCRLVWHPAVRERLAQKEQA